VQAFCIAEQLSLPVMVCMDGFVLTHAVEPVDVPAADLVDAFLPPYEPRQVLDPADPVSIGAMVGPEAFTEVRYLAHIKHRQALEVIPVECEPSELAGLLSARRRAVVVVHHDIPPALLNVLLRCPWSRMRSY